MFFKNVRRIIDQHLLKETSHAACLNVCISAIVVNVNLGSRYVHKCVYYSKHSGWQQGCWVSISRPTGCMEECEITTQKILLFMWAHKCVLGKSSMRWIIQKCVCTVCKADVWFLPWLCLEKRWELIACSIGSSLSSHRILTIHVLKMNILNRCIWSLSSRLNPRQIMSLICTKVLCKSQFMFVSLCTVTVNMSSNVLCWPNIWYTCRRCGLFHRDLFSAWKRLSCCVMALLFSYDVNAE